MTLRHKTLLSIGAALIGLLLLLYVVAARIWLSGFERVEAAETRQNVYRVGDALSERITRLDQVTNDYAAWDDTCRFMRQRNADYIDRNLLNEVWDNLQLNYVFYIQPSGEVTYSLAYDFATQRRQSLSPAAALALTSAGLHRFARPGQSRSGLLKMPTATGQRVVLFAARPVVTSDHKGPVRGAVIFARHLDAREIEQLAHLTHLGLALEPLGDHVLPAEFQDAQAKLNAQPPPERGALLGAPLVRVLNSDTVSGYALLHDGARAPIAVLRVDAPRSVYTQGRSTARIFLVSLVIAAAVFSIVPLLLLEKLVLRRLIRLGDEVSEIGTHPEAVMQAATRVSVQGRDELAGLAARINAMLGTLAESQRRLREGEELYREMSQLALSASDALFVVPLDVAPEDWAQEEVPLAWHGQVVEMLGLDSGYEPESLREWLLLVHEQDRASLRRAIERARQTGELFQRECRVRGSDGAFRHWMVRGKPLMDEHGQPVKFIGACTDVTDRKVLEERLAHQAFHDPLTNLPNRVLFLDRVEQALARARRANGGANAGANGGAGGRSGVAVLFVDLDNFKVINDSLGHSIGDALLVAVASRLQSFLRGGDTACRFGGDEFTILLEQIEPANDSALALQIAERIVQVLQAPFSLGGRDVYITASVGIALSENSDHADSLLRNADAAMYEAKRKGKDRIALFRANASEATQRRLEWENDLRHALEGGQFKLHYQPIIDLRRGGVVGFEALLRWQHPQRGLISPLQFIPLAEETGQIVPLGRWVLENACQQMRHWQAQFPAIAVGAPLCISVNLSPRQLQHAALPAHVEDVLRQTGLPPASLLLEVTENILQDEGSEKLNCLRTLKTLGVQIAVDDFGTAHSPLNYLKSAPIDYLKIDRRLIAELAHLAPEPLKITQTPSNGHHENGAHSTELLSSVISLAHRLHLRVVGEGAEIESEVAGLRRLGCDMVQGYFFSPPLPQDHVAAYLQNGAAQAR